MREKAGGVGFVRLSGINFDFFAEIFFVWIKFYKFAKSPRGRQQACRERWHRGAAWCGDSNIRKGVYFALFLAHQKPEKLF